MKLASIFPSRSLFYQKIHNIPITAKVRITIAYLTERKLRIRFRLVASTMRFPNAYLRPFHARARAGGKPLV